MPTAMVARYHAPVWHAKTVPATPEPPRASSPRRTAIFHRAPIDSVGKAPDYRFSLANERTFLAWIRTALALLAAGVAVVQLLPRFDVPGGSLTLGVILVALSLVVAVGSYFRWDTNERAMRMQQTLRASRVPPLLALGLTAVAILAMIMILIND